MPFTGVVGITNIKNNQSNRMNNVPLIYPNYKKDVDLNAHVKMFNFAMKVNGKTSREYIINAFRYMLRDITSYWCHNYMLKFLDCIFFNSYKHFVSIIETFRMTNRYT
jgi:hypothetical protein